MQALNAYISCPKGIEALLKDELDAIGGFELIKQHIGGLSGKADLPTLYKIVLWSRLANRVLLQLNQTAVDSKADLQQWLSVQPWSEHMSAQQTLHIRFFGELPGIQHSQYGAQFVKDMIADYFRNRSGRRPNVDKEQPDLRFQLNIEKRGGKSYDAQLHLDLSGDSLHQRGYRRGITAAPLKENLAAALLIRAQWPQIAAAGGSLIDPLCGSGTFLTEAALIAADVAPGLLRQRFGFSRWLQHDSKIWQQLTDEAQARRKQQLPPIIGYDEDRRALGVAEQHIAALQLGGSAPRVYAKSLADWKKPSHTTLPAGLLIANPPYGERLGKQDDLPALYDLIGRKWREECPDWRAALLTSDETLAKATRLFWDKTYKFYNGALECRLYLFDLGNKQLRANDISDKLRQIKHTDTSDVDVTPLIHRIEKNRQRLKGWLKQQNIHCYRLYYADIPEFAVAIDIYNDWAMVQEYQAPRSIDATKAEKRLAAIMQSLPELLQLPRAQIILKERQRQKGKSQYEKLGDHKHWLQVQEGDAHFWINLHDYLDSGLFLDHRPLRLKLAKDCHGKRFLNLFCYTAAATVHAAIGGANSSTSVDLSNTYLEWAQRNFSLNNIDTNKHELVRADVTSWLQQHRQQYDVIFFDPPTFSNSKSMQDEMDIQRDHAALIGHAMRCLSRDGVLYFSCNFRRFKLDPVLQQRFQIRDITEWSIPRDFARPGKIHHCFEIRHLSNPAGKTRTTSPRS